jgi:hypothetical protein
MRLVWTSVLVVALLAGGCCLLGPINNPSPTTKPVAPADIAGTWTILGQFETATVTFDFREDGTFTETIPHAAPAAPEILTGEYTLEGSELRLKILRPGAKGAPGTPDGVLWRILDSGEKGQKFDIYGNVDDNDYDDFYRFKKVR